MAAVVSLLHRFRFVVLSISFALAAHSAFADDTFANLIKQKIEAFSVASAKGDQPSMDRLLTDEVLFSGGTGTVDHEPKLDENGPLSILLKKQTQAFLEAAHRDNSATMSTFLAPETLFVNEDGHVSTPHEFLPASPGVNETLSLTGWLVHTSGDVAATSYILERVALYPTRQTLTHKSLSVDAWIKHDGVWKLVASQMIPLYQTPAPVVLPAGDMAEYTGTYSASPSPIVVLTKDAGNLAASINGAKPILYKPEARDLFYADGLPPGSPPNHLLFRRDASGRVTGYVNSLGLPMTKAAVEPPATPLPAISSEVLPAADLIVHRTGNLAIATFIHERVIHYPAQTRTTKYRSTEMWIKRGEEWKMLTLQSQPLPQDPVSVALTSKERGEYAGNYSLGSILRFKISEAGDALTIAINDGKAARLEAAVHDVFFTPGSPRTSILFQRDASGHITGCIQRQNGNDLVLARSLL